MNLNSSIGYALKRTSWALRGAMDAALRDLDLSVSQYACLEVLAQRPGVSNAELARGVFVSRQATHQLLSGLIRADLVAIEGTGRDQRIRLTEHGSTRLTAASATVAAVEERMLSTLSSAQRTALLAGLDSCADALREPPPD